MPTSSFFILCSVFCVQFKETKNMKRKIENDKVCIN